MSDAALSFLPYWRNALADTIKCAPDTKKVEEALEISLADIKSGKVPREIYEKLAVFQKKEQSKYKRNNTEDKEEKPIPVIMMPLIMLPEVSHGQRRSIATLVAPLCIGARIDREGNCLLPSDEKIKPWMVREVLMPTDSDLIVGTIEKADEFYTQHIKPLACWNDAIDYASSLFEAVAGQAIEDFAAEGYKCADKARIMWGNPLFTTQNIIKLYDVMSEQKLIPPLLRTLIEQQKEEPLLDDNTQLVLYGEHLGQMNGEYSLSTTQREALTHFLAKRNEEAEVLAINGPPGTGKTTLLQSAVATLWVETAWKQMPCPIIVASSCNNQAITNIIDSFGKVEAVNNDPLGGRWIKHVKSYGLYMPPTKEEGRHCFVDIDDHFCSAYENSEALLTIEADYLDCFNRAFSELNITTIAEAKAFLHHKLNEQVIEIKNIISFYQILKNTLSKPEISLSLLKSYSQEMTDTLSSLEEEINAVRLKYQHITNAEKHWEDYIAQEPFWLVLFFFLPTVKRKKHAMDKRFLDQHGLYDEEVFKALNRPVVRDEVGDLLSKTKENYKKILSTLDTEHAKLSGNFALFLSQYDPFVRWCSEKNIGGSLIEVSAILDTHCRFRAFQIATHYWEAAYIEEVQKNLADKEFKDNKAPEKLERLYRRLAKLTPCFVSTFYMLPKSGRFVGFSGTVKPLYSVIDMLIVDEAGQVLPEIGAASFGLAKRALIVGDTHQIEPVRTIGKALDYQNAKRHKVVANDHEYTSLVVSGKASASGSMMQMAQHASRFTKHPDIARGLFLAEHRRCVPEIIGYCNDLVYKGRLEPKRPSKGLDSFSLPPMGWAHIESEDNQLGTSRYNIGEAEVIAEWIKKRKASFEEHYQKPLHDILGIITPFSAQTGYLLTALQKELGDKHNITVGTVNALQGAERDIIIFSSVYGSSYTKKTLFDKNPSILNVAVSRAKDHFLVFGNTRLFSRSFSEPSSLLGRYLFAQTANEITDITIPSILNLHGKKISTAGKLIDTLDKHIQVLSEAIITARSRLIIVSPLMTTKVLKGEENLLEHLRSAVRKKVEVLIYTDPSLHNDEYQFKQCVEMLKDTGATIRLATKKGIHSKLLCADEAIFVLGSFNWFSAVRDETRLYQRYETSMILKDSQEISTFVEKILESLETCV